jgi:hypothetical protein
MHKRQIELVEFSEKIYHLGLRHTGINGSLYEDLFIKILREELPKFDFYKGQIKGEIKPSPQYDILICKKDTPQIDFLREVNPLVNIVDAKNCYGVIELKKWAYPKMINETGEIQNAYYHFKILHPTLKYFFVALRFKDRKKGSTNWNNLKIGLNVDGKFCFFGRTEHSDQEWLPWTEKLIKKHENYDFEFEKLIEMISNLT